jgi:Protein of unknown function (DUF3105).
MAKTNKDRDRRAVIEQMRREQKRGERRRTSMIIGACVVVALAIVAVPAWQVFQQEKAAAGDLESIGVNADAASCDDVVTAPAEGNNEHKPEGSTVVYDDAPPAFGPHYPTPAPFARKYYSAAERPDLPYLVHNLEHGYNILWYDQTVAGDSAQLAAVKAIAAKFEGQKLTDKFIAAPWTDEDGKPFPDGKHVALTHWSLGGGDGDPAKQVGVWQYCAAPSGEVVAEFVKKYPFSDSPEPQAL